MNCGARNWPPPKPRREANWRSSPPCTTTAGLIATLAKKEDALPVRVVATLAPGQSLTLSTPHEAGTPPDAVDFIRRADTVLIHEAAAGLTN